MKSLKEIMGKDRHVWFDIWEEDFKAFLQFAKDNGCKWMNGDEINVEKDHIGHHMGINKDKQLGFVSMWCWFAKAKNEPRKIEFKKLLKTNFENFSKSWVY